ncbi:MAG: hypothetical protein GDA39_10215 [Hyphomonadaceae bacterium]|nr:hypothetical protein [Hyphomonadaceae bacterium]
MPYKTVITLHTKDPGIFGSVHVLEPYTLPAIRDLLLPKLTPGEICLREAGEAVEAET